MGLGAGLWEHEGNGHGGGDSKYFGPGDHEYVGDAVQDKTSFIRVYDYSDFYMSSGDRPAVGPIFGTTGGTGEYKHRDWSVRIPAGYKPTWHISTRNGNHVHEPQVLVQDRMFHVRLSVGRHMIFGRRNWIGIQVRCTLI